MLEILCKLKRLLRVEQISYFTVFKLCVEKSGPGPYRFIQGEVPAGDHV